MDCIHINRLRCYGYTGLLPEEQVLGQWFEADITLWVDLSLPGCSDLIEDTLDYRIVIQMVQQTIHSARFALLERLAAAIVEAILTSTPVGKVQIRLTKLAPPIPEFGGQITVELTRSA
ncbi:dihydroneopterin aldolase [Neosynechococcus sphagnicola sy1]|uniref:7,8-dihydroneopterin aldolase n=2 Tax=Neosynechococcus TaxID=1501143 RepID=A0A098TQB9_9CYAN|nr:dihydroneopterin aldolase [Neosynechococcus sphagnicola sy1]